MTELLVVIGIIVLLIGLLIPVISSVRVTGQSADTRALISAIDSSVQAYFLDHQAYPGPLPETQLGPNTPALPVAVPAGVEGFDTTEPLSQVTGTENLVLGLLGGMRCEGGAVGYDPSRVGQGATRLREGGVPQSYQPYVEVRDGDLSWRDGPNGRTGRYQDEGSADNSAVDSIIPAFVDRFPNAMPILYLRSNERAAVAAGFTGAENYNLNAVVGYTRDQGSGRYIGVGRSPTNNAHANAGTPHGLSAAGTAGPLAGDGPWDGIPYLTAPGGGVRKDASFILISPGPDRVYGTRDDITNFGSVVP